MIRIFCLAVAAVAAVAMEAGAYEPVKSPLMTEWGEKVTPENAWRDYPRPQMVRDSWANLNGEWDYAITSVTNTPGRPEKWDGRILVPFALESALSGVGKLLEPDQFLWYTRKINCAKNPGERILLHFDGVDFRTMVFIGHKEVTDVPHEGAQDPFALDITDFVTEGENELTVCCWDPTGGRSGFINSRGKQVLNPGGCFYTRVSGIWQSVWMETVPEDHIAGYRVFPDIDAGTVKLAFDVHGMRYSKPEVEVMLDGIRSVTVDGAVTIRMPKDFVCWSPENPKLYGFTACCGKDRISGYFAMRKFEKRKDARRVLRFFLNNRPCFLLGTLDQGWWPDGLLTPPSEEAMVFDIRTLKDCGYNMMRKHIKVEPLRYYHLCDKMGILVLQDLPCASSDKHDPVKLESVFGYGFQRVELKRMIDLLQKTPSVVMWVPYNEGWGQPGEFLTHSTLDWIGRYDRTRLVGGPSGAWDFEGGQKLPKGWRWSERIATEHRPAGCCEAADTVDLHLYRSDHPEGTAGRYLMFPANDRRISFLGEFGGFGHPVDGHLWKPLSDSWGYGGVEDTKTREGLESVYLKAMEDVAELAERGLGGCVYTQTTDVEIEINGLMTYDRKVLKFNPEVLKKAHEEVIRRATAPKCKRINALPKGNEPECSDIVIYNGKSIDWTDKPLVFPGLWDLSAHGTLEIELENTSTNDEVRLCVDIGAGDESRCRLTMIPAGFCGTIALDVCPRLAHPEVAAQITNMRTTPFMGGDRDEKCDPVCISAISLRHHWTGASTASHGKTPVVRVRRVVAKDTSRRDWPAWYSMVEKDFFPFVDRYGQFRYRDWPRKVRTDADLKDAAEAEEKDMKSNPPPAAWDRYGGWGSGPRLETTGRFRLTKWHEKWWFVDSDGHLWWSHGVVRVSPSSAVTPLDGREKYFADLPPDSVDEPFAEFYHTNDELLKPYFVKYGWKRTYDFSAANLKRKYGAGWRGVFADLSHRRLLSWGLNTIANSSDAAIRKMNRTPWIERLETRGPRCKEQKNEGFWWHVPDPFHPEFRRYLREQLEARRDELTSPWCVGVFVDNEHNWTGIGEKTVREYFKVVHEEIKRLDPNLLYFGCRFAGSPERVVRICAEYADALSYNPYRLRLDGLKLPQGVDKPVLIGEFHFGSTVDTGLFNPSLVQMNDQSQRARAYCRYVTDALRHPQVVGTHWHQFSDQAVTGRFDGENFNVGLTDVCDSPYPELRDGLRQMGHRMYELRAGYEVAEHQFGL